MFPEHFFYNKVMYLKKRISKVVILILQAWLILRRDVVVITTTLLYLSKPELRLCAGSNAASDLSEVLMIKLSFI